MNGIKKLEARITEINSLLCVGLDTDIRRLPFSFSQENRPQYAFNRAIIDQTHPYAAAYKLNTAFYEARGAQGWDEMHETVTYIREQHPSIFIIADAKRADIGSTNEAYVQALYDDLGFDAVTLHPYVGREALEPFLAREDKVSIILCRTSNSGAGEFQDLLIGDRPLWMIVAERVANEWNQNKNCMLVVGATYPQEMRRIREITGEMYFLVPGIGAQGGDLPEVMRAGLNTDRRGLLINASRSIVFADNPANTARSLAQAINQERLRNE